MGPSRPSESDPGRRRRNDHDRSRGRPPGGGRRLRPRRGSGPERRSRPHGRSYVEGDAMIDDGNGIDELIRQEAIQYRADRERRERINTKVVQLKRERQEEYGCLEEAPPALGEWDAGDDLELPPPRGWLLGNIFCRRFMSSLLADGGVGKTALRYAQLMSCAIGRSLTGEHVFQRCRVLIISLEDDQEELRRRVLAACLHYGIDREELKGWLFLAAPGAAGGKLMTFDKRGNQVRGSLADNLEKAISDHKIDIVSIDPFVKAHSVEENNNSGIDDVVQLLTDLAAKYDLAIDAPHHTSKGPADPGNADRGRGASAMKDAGRLIYTLTTMSQDEAKVFGISEKERREFVRMDSGKVNITRHLGTAKWFRLIGVRLGNASELYPHGDEVQTVEPWKPPETWADLNNDLINRILDEIDGGLEDGSRYSDAPNAKRRAAWKVVLKYATTKTEAQAREIVRTWVENGLLVADEYDDPLSRRPRTSPIAW